jgi:serine/threonine protein kinase
MPDNTDRSHVPAGGPRASREKLVAGRYQLVRELGRGGMSVVWLAVDTALGRQVALKELHRPAGLPEADRELYRRRAQQEARSAARIRHPNAVTLHDVLSDASDGTDYLVMEFIEGPTLADLISREGALPAPRVADFGRQLLDVLAAAHALGIVHRDVKPGNIMIAPGDQVKLADFGIAFVESDARLTGSGVIGTHSFTAPELFESAPVTPAVDLWALGATLYSAADGHSPFDRNTTGATLRAVLLDELPVPRCDARLAAAIAALLHRNPAERATIDQARALLAQVPGQLPNRAPSQVPGRASGQAPSPVSGPPTPEIREDPPTPPCARTPVPASDSPRSHRARGPAIIAVAAVVVVAAVVAGLLATQSHHGSGKAAAAKTATRTPAKTAGPTPIVPIASLFSEQSAGQAVAFATSGGQIRYDSYAAGWHGPGVLPGTPRAGSPLVLSPDGEHVFFFAKNGSVVNDYLSGSTWQGPYPVGGTAGADSGLSFSEDGNDSHPTVVFVDTGGKLVYDDYTTSWQGPVTLPGTPQSGSPLLISQDSDNVFFLSQNGDVVNDYDMQGSDWQGPAPVGGTAEAGSGLALFPGAGSAHPAIAFVSTSGKLVYDSYSASANWSGTYPLPGTPRTGSPITWNANGTSVYFIESGGRVADDSRSGSGWSGPVLTGGTAARGSALEYAQGTGSSAGPPSLMFIDSDSDSALVEDSYASGWHGPGPLPGA